MAQSGWDCPVEYLGHLEMKLRNKQNGFGYQGNIPALEAEIEKWSVMLEQPEAGVEAPADAVIELAAG